MRDFILENEGADAASLLLKYRGKWNESFSLETAVSTIESRKALKSKVPEWYSIPELVLPRKLSAEQCSSSATAFYKAAVAGGPEGPAGIAALGRVRGRGPSLLGKDSPKGAYRTGPSGPQAAAGLADLTGGLGVDAWAFSKVFGKVLYNEMDTELSEAARHNFGVLGADNITVRNGELTAESLEEILGGFSPDVIYLDPARRSGSGGKVFLISDCKPDVTGLLRLLLKKAGKVMIKYSPMLDIARAAKELGGSLREVHVVASGGECKELLFILESGHSGEFRIVVSELPSGQFSFTPREEAEAAPIFADRAGALEGQWLFEPGKALMKAGAFNLTSQRFGLRKMGRSTHIYAAEKPVEGLMGLGRWLRVKEVIPLTGRSLKETGKRFPRAEVSARNIPMSSDQLRRRIGCGSGDEARIYGLRIDTTDGKSNNYLIIS